MSETLAPRGGQPRVPGSWGGGGAQVPCTPGLYLDGELPHGVFRELFLILVADPEGPVGGLFCGPVVDTFLGGRELGVRGGHISWSRKGWSALTSCSHCGALLGLAPAAQLPAG